MDSQLRSSIEHILQWLLYASAGFGALAYALFLRTGRDARTFSETHGLLDATQLNPRDVLEQKLRGVEALRGLAIVVMLIGFLFWPLLILGVLLFFFQTNAWKSTQSNLVALDRDQPEYQQAQRLRLGTLSAAARSEHQRLESNGSRWQRVFAVTMAIALVLAVFLLVLYMTNGHSAAAP